MSKGFSKLPIRSLVKTEIKKLLKKTTDTKTKNKTKTKTKNNTNTKNKTNRTRYASAPKSGIITSGGLLSNNVKIFNKILLGKLGK
tara:strand:+ start:255 stop:512 length:258 start_codon:yes stop_codon:yes gene_type:complete